MKIGSILLSLLIIGILPTTYNMTQLTFGQLEGSMIEESGNYNQTAAISESNTNITAAGENYVDNFERWINVTGQWILDEGGLHGGSESGKVALSNILLNPNSLPDIKNLSTSFRINDLNMVVPNYAAIVYSFYDPENYKFAGINLFENRVYTIFFDINNGTITSTPPWPGLQTNLKWEPNTSYHLSLDDRVNSIDLLINGTSYYSLPANNVENFNGMNGLYYGRIHDINFMNFIAEANDGIESDYLKPDTRASLLTDSLTVRLGDKTVPENEFVHLYTSRPYGILNGHISAVLPCNEDQLTDISLLAGNPTEIQPIEIGLTHNDLGTEDLCLYEGNLNSNLPNPVTDIILQNNSPDEIEFPSSSSVTITIDGMSSGQN